jgi:hypothetical protein
VCVGLGPKYVQVSKDTVSVNIVTRLSDRRRGIGLSTGFIGHFNN